ncbi:MAG: DUF411 domain-containing protein [Anaerolineales bacterium]|nr:MAG: DUF411 domain-containing protein [Anaerolineales bacterium]
MVHLQENDYVVDKIDMGNQELMDLNVSLGIPSELSSCHTAQIEGYIVEGHVPADVIEAMLAEKPDILGLALPGMPQGAPGMDGVAEGPLEILAFDAQGNVWVYATR